MTENTQNPAEETAVAAETDAPEEAAPAQEAPAASARFDTSKIIPGATIRVSQKIKEGEKERVQVFEGLVIAKRGRTGINTTITVRKVSNGVGVERIFPLAMPTITNIEVVKQAIVRRAKLHFMRNPRAKKLREAKKK